MGGFSLGCLVSSQAALGDPWYQVHEKPRKEDRLLTARQERLETDLQNLRAQFEPKLMLGYVFWWGFALARPLWQVRQRIFHL